VTLVSMTGFAREIGSTEAHSWVWEAKCVNGRGLDCRFRTPQGLDHLEEILRKKVKSLFNRGNFSLGLQLTRKGQAQKYQVNTEFLSQLVSVAKEQAKSAGLEPPRVEALISVKGIVDLDEQADDEEAQKNLESSLLKSAEILLIKLLDSRQEEGKRLQEIIARQVDDIENLTEAAGKTASLRPENVRARITKQMGLILGDDNILQEDRLEQELAILATKADISEELDRLKAHVASARDMIMQSNGEAVGRRLDFLCQEFNRESNTLCSKSNDKELTRIGLDMKVVIDQLKEQVQNIE
jgi:uncharacterized protein (TIGR00255 family)